MAVRASLYLNDELQKEMEGRKGSVGVQLDRLFSAYKQSRRELSYLFAPAELEMLLYAVEYGTDDDDPEETYWLPMNAAEATIDAEELLEGRPPNDAVKTEKLKGWANKLDEVAQEKVLEKVSNLHPFDALTLVDAMEQALYEGGDKNNPNARPMTPLRKLQRLFPPQKVRPKEKTKEEMLKEVMEKLGEN